MMAQSVKKEALPLKEAAWYARAQAAWYAHAHVSTTLFDRPPATQKFIPPSGIWQVAKAASVHGL